MEEETNFDICFGLANLLSEHCWKEHQVIVVYPDEVTVLNIFRNSSREKPVCLLVSIPSGLIKGNFARMVVE